MIADQNERSAALTAFAENFGFDWSTQFIEFLLEDTAEFTTSVYLRAVRDLIHGLERPWSPVGAIREACAHIARGDAEDARVAEQIAWEKAYHRRLLAMPPRVRAAVPTVSVSLRPRLTEAEVADELRRQLALLRDFDAEVFHPNPTPTPTSPTTGERPSPHCNGVSP